DPGYDLAFDAGSSKRQRFLAAAPEHKRIAALQSNDLMAAPRFADHQAIDCVLRDCRTASPLADEESPRPRRELQRLRIDQSVVEHQIGRLEPLDRLQCQKVGIARTGADE